MKKIFLAVIVTAVICVSGWNISKSMSETTLSDMALANVEALAQEAITGKGFVFCSGTDVICTGTGSFTCCR
ncbi:MAG: NVEALA domain-containing protein [Prevotellaceae bacterium]|jgi:hypothetical protein|nr:NVEALA domain-containing protein [Prevotellaceae bacterium]